MKKKHGQDSPPLAFDCEVESITPQKGKGITAARIWTANKANLIQNYLRRFIRITRGGTYLDLFSGPQSHEEAWAAKLVLESEPRRLYRFALFEKVPASVIKLRQLAETHRRKLPRRKIRVIEGDCNVEAPEYFRLNAVRSTTPVFCLLDQRTLECSWETVKAVAKYKRSGRKVEQFYFLAIWWFDRTVAINERSEVERWWGKPDWARFMNAHRGERPHMMADRFRCELKYQYVNAYPIYEKRLSKKVMFYMIHASDHHLAKGLMDNAYNTCVGAPPDTPLRDVDLFPDSVW